MELIVCASYYRRIPMSRLCVYRILYTSNIWMGLELRLLLLGG